MFYNVHFKLWSTVCRSDFLGVSVQLTHIFCSTLCISHFLFLVQLINILCFTISIWHHVLQCACLIFLVFQCNSLIYWVLHCAFPIFCFSVQLINILCVTMGISHYVLQCTDLISRLFCVSHSYTVFSTGNLKFSIYFSENHSYNMFHNVHFTLCLQCAGLFF